MLAFGGLCGRWLAMMHIRFGTLPVLRRLRLTFSRCSSLACSLCAARFLGKNPLEKLELNLPASVIMHAEFPTYTWQTWPRFSPHPPLPQAAATHMAKLPLNGFGCSRGERDDEPNPWSGSLGLTGEIAKLAPIHSGTQEQLLLNPQPKHSILV